MPCRCDSVVVKLLSVFMLKCPWALGQLGDHPRTLKVVQIIAQGVESSAPKAQPCLRAVLDLEPAAPPPREVPTAAVGGRSALAAAAAMRIAAGEGAAEGGADGAAA